MFWKPTMAVEADVASFIVAVSEKLKLNTAYQQPIGWLNQLKQSNKVVYSQKNIKYFLYVDTVIIMQLKIVSKVIQ